MRALLWVGLFLFATILSARAQIWVPSAARVGQAKALRYESSFPYGPPPGRIPNEELEKSYERDPVIFIPGIMGSRFIKENENGDDYLAYLSLGTLLGRPFEEILLSHELEQLDAPFEIGTSAFQPFTTSLNFFRRELLNVLTKEHEVFQKDALRPIKRTELVDCVGFWDHSMGYQISDSIQSSFVRREIPLLGSSGAVNDALVRSQIPGIKQIGLMGQALGRVPGFDLFLDKGLLGILDDVNPGRPCTVEVYQGIIRRLRTMGYSSDDGSLHIFPYDWRQNNFYTALQLKDYIESHPQLKGKKVHIVAHSMGNIVATLYMNAFGGSSRVHRHTLIAPPLRGSVRALWYLLNGQPMFNLFYKKHDIREVMFWSPSVWQLLPRDQWALKDTEGNDLMPTFFSPEGVRKVLEIVDHWSDTFGDSEEIRKRRRSFAKLNLKLLEYVDKVIEEDEDFLCEELWKKRNPLVDCKARMREIANVRRTTIYAKNTAEPNSLFSLTFDFEKDEVVDQVYNNHGDGTVPFSGVLRKDDYEKYLDLDFRIKRGPWDATFKPDSRPRPDFNVTQNKAQSFLNSAIEGANFFDLPLDFVLGGEPGAIDFLTTNLPRGLVFDRRTTLKMVPTADHNSILDELPTLKAIKHAVREDLLIDNYGFQRLSVTHDYFGGFQVLWRVFGAEAEQCRPGVATALRFVFERELQYELHRNSPPEDFIAHLENIETFSKFSVFSIYCGPSENGRQVTVWLHDYRRLLPAHHAYTLALRGDAMLIHNHVFDTHEEPGLRDYLPVLEETMVKLSLEKKWFPYPFTVIPELKTSPLAPRKLSFP